MQVIPAIDIRGGRCVRLVQGDYERETVYDADPLAVATEWRRQGATRLHVVDLDGAREGEPVNRAVIERIAATVGIPVQVGGGLRSERDVRACIDAGVDRVILGTSAVEHRGLIEWLSEAFGEKLAVGIDARDGVVMTRGWLQSGELSAPELARSLRAIGVARFIYTDISRDGMLQGPNLAALRQFITAAGRPVIASGGISSVDHLLDVAGAGAEAAIVGKALYERRLRLPDALAAVLKESQ